MVNHECEWVRLRLPLCEHAIDECVHPRGSCEAGELSARTHRHIERHVASCAACRDYRRSLARALGVLGAAAAQTPVDTGAPSLWPALERRIANREVGAATFPITASVPARPWDAFDENRPLRDAWARDSVNDFSPADPKPRRRLLSRMPVLILTSGVAAALLAIVAYSALDRQWKNAHTTILTNRSPLPEPNILLPADAEPPVEIVEHLGSDTSANQLAEAELPRPAEAPSPAGIDPAAASRPSNRGRFGFDLDRGTPMPPESRDAKPVY